MTENERFKKIDTLIDSIALECKETGSYEVPKVLDIHREIDSMLVKETDSFLKWAEDNEWTYFASDQIWIRRQDYMNGKETSELFALYGKETGK